MKKKAILLMLVLMFITTNALSQNIIHGKIIKAVQAGISVELYKTSCGGDTLIGTFTTNSEGYYAFGCLDNGDYKVTPKNVNYTFSPEFDDVQIPQTIIQSYDFTATDNADPCSTVDRFVNNGDGTVTDCRTDLIWLKNADCYILSNWSTAMTSADGLNSGECGLTDGSIEGDWHLATKEELQGIGTDPPAIWGLGTPETWTKPGTPFVDVSDYDYWSSTDYSGSSKWYIRMGTGQMSQSSGGYTTHVWPVRSGN